MHTAQLAPVFAFREQALVCIPADFPEVRGMGEQHEFLAQLITSLTKVAQASEGRMMVLFTSNKMLRQVYYPLKERLRRHNITVLAQGIDKGRAKLVRRFMDQEESCVLLGTKSFWEGVDIPGSALSVLAIVRLPFVPPSDPIFEAKTEQMRDAARNPFNELALPQAVITFKQGFGRLIRTAQDKGVVVIYDVRVDPQRNRYAKNFLYSLPGPKIELLRASLLPERVKTWLMPK
jgi:ATP-dependent DNA helicase DinG